MLEKIRSALLDEANSSPQLISDLAGLESYVAESYDSRSFIELLQNADDAESSSFLVKKYNQYLIVCNDGKIFSDSDLASICRSAASNKRRGDSIGYRGIGFKSVVSLAQEIHILSGQLETTFSKKLTLNEIPKATKVPLLRIPHPIDPIVKKNIADQTDNLLSSGYKTFFIFNDLIANSIDKEFVEFNSSSLLFLKNIRNLSLDGERKESVTVSRNKINDIFSIFKLETAFLQRNWIVAAENGVSIAFQQDPNSGNVVKASETDAVVHAFLPTHESTGLGVKLNGDISTDPSRTRIVFDQRTKSGITLIAKLIAKIIFHILKSAPLPDPVGMLKSLLPNNDPSTQKWQKQSFSSELIAEVKNECKDFIHLFSIKPSWLNTIDFQKICESAKITVAPCSVNEIDEAVRFMRFLEAKEVKLRDISSSFINIKISNQGCVEIVSEIIRLHETKQITTMEIDIEWPIFISNGNTISISHLKERNLTLDSSFIDLVSERTSGLGGLSRLIKAIAGSEMGDKLIPQLTNSPQNTQQNIPSKKEFLHSINDFSIQKPHEKKNKNLSLKKWRGAEEQVRNIFESYGWIATDVSRQNIGYDIECKNHAGEKIYVEVKLVETPSQSFTMTSNEEAVARQKNESYILAIVRQERDTIEINFIPDPVKNLEFTRQCRQWVWECSSYPYNPEIFNLS